MSAAGRPRAVLTRALTPEVMERLRCETDLAESPDGGVLAGPALAAALAGADALLCTINDRVDAALLDAAPRLRVVANFGVGFNHIDLAAATGRRIQVTNTPGVLTAASADLAFALLLATVRRLGEGERLVRSGAWTGWEPLQLLGLELGGAQLGIVGYGRIGRAVAARARAFGMRTVQWNRTTVADDPDAPALGLDELLRTSDVVSLHVAYTPQTHHLLDARALGLLGPGAYLVNTARGAVVDEAALVRALREGRLAGAGLDVYEHEPRLAAGLADLPNCVLLPHLGSATSGTRTRMGHLAVDNLLAACAGRRAPNLVNTDVLIRD